MMINKSHDDIESLTTEVKISSSELFTTYEQDEISANNKYLDKVIEVEGKVSQVKTDDHGKTKVHLATDDMIFEVICELDDFSNHKRKTFEIGENIVLKGICSGYLSDVIIVRSIEIIK